MCAPRHAAAVVRPRERKKSADRRRRILISRLLIIRASVPRRKSPFPAYFKGFPAVSLLIPPYPAFLKYPVSPHKGTGYITEVPREDGIAYYQIKKNPVVLEGKIIGIVGLISDITERVRLEKQAQNWAIHDELTGLYNRNYLKVKGAEQLKGAIMPITIIMGDCNYLKRVNDAYGHEYGDLLLKRVGRVIRENLPPESVALRMGGDEFLIACSHFSAEEAEQLIERLHGELARQSDDRLKLDVAFGYHTVTEGPFDYTAVYHAADRDMYRNKRKNR